MKRFLALLLCAALCLQPAMAADAGSLTAGEAVQEEDKTQEGEPQKTSDAAVEGKKDAADKKASGIDVSAPSALLMESSTGQVIYEKDADSVRPPASVTKVMTLLLIFDALKEGRIKLEDEVTTSEYAASMGGSQVFLEAGD